MFKLKYFSKFLCDSCGKRESGSEYLEKYKEIKSNQELSYPGEAWAAGKKKLVSLTFNLSKNLKFLKCLTRHDLELRQARETRRRTFRVGPGDIKTYSKTSFDSEAGFSAGGCLAWVRGSVERELLREMAVIGVEVMVDSEEHDLGKEAPISEGERREKEDDTKEVDYNDKVGTISTRPRSATSHDFIISSTFLKSGQARFELS